MKFLLLAAFVAFCTASTLYRGKNISVNDDGTILITTAGGKKVEITRPMGYNGQKSIDIVISGPNMPTKRIQINDDSNSLYQSEIRNTNRYPWSSVDSLSDEEFRPKRSSKKTQGDVLAEILGEYQGSVDEPLFEKLLTKIEKAVKKGEINRQIYDLLVSLDQIDNASVWNSIVSQKDLSNQYVNSYPYGYATSYPYGYGSSYPYGYASSYPYGKNVIGNGVIAGYGYNVVCKNGQCYEQTIVPRNPVSWYSRGIPQVYAVDEQQQIPIQNGIYGNNVYGYGLRQNVATSRYVNPLLEAAIQQNTIGGLLRQQQLNNVMQGGVYQTVPLGVNTVRGILSGDNALAKEYLLGSQQIPYGQSVGNLVDLLKVQQQQQPQQQIQQQLQQQQGYGNLVGVAGRQQQQLPQYYNQPLYEVLGLKEGNLVRQQQGLLGQQMGQQPVIYQNDRIVPQVAY